MATIEGLSEPWRANGVWKALSLVPFVMALAIPLLSPTYFAPMYGKPPDLLGIPFGFVLEVILLAWAALGTIVIWTTRSPAMATLALVTTTLPGTALQFFVPALVPIMVNLSV